MIIVRTPYRVSFFGGGSDYPAWFRANGGAVLTSTLNKYCYISLRKMPAFLGSKYLIFWSRMEKANRREDIQHPGVRGCLEYLGIDEGIEINHAGDLPARSGLGSSSAFTVGMLNALHALRGEHVGPGQLADEAIHVEQDVLKETVGIQDQIECAHGGLNLINIDPEGGYSVAPVIMPAGRRSQLESRLMLFFTGLQRNASDIAAAQVANADRKHRELSAIVGLVPQVVSCLARGEISSFGPFLHEAWMLKRELAENVSNEKIDDIYRRATEAGAKGGKLLGAGSGGFFLFYVPVQSQPAVRAALGDLLEIPFKFGSEGSRIVLYEP